ncbi:MAG: aldose epimerase [Elainella sp. Prado103]|nr:aldose epimerase [Elainella sp. Prado103]
MFTVTTEQRQYQTYILQDQSSATVVEVVPARGGIITQWRVQDQDILYLDHDRFQDPTLTVRGGIPILFPICGNLPHNTYTYLAQAYQLKQHGFARDLPWQVVDQSTQDAASLTLELSSTEQTKCLYPFDFQLRFTYQLCGRTLSLQQQYTNRSERAMPFSTGLHPYFWVGDKTQLQFEIPAIQLQSQPDHSQHPFHGQFNFETDEIDVAFRQLSQQTTRVIDRQRQLSLTMDYDAVYSTLVFWTVKGKDFYCLEPWSAPRNALNSGDNLLELQPGASLETRVQLAVDLLQN